MKLKHGGIHKRLGFIIQHSGGYDKEFHILKVANELNIDRYIIERLFKESLNSRLMHYIKLLENNTPVDKVFRLVEKDNKMFDRKYGIIKSLIYEKYLYK